MMINMDSEEEGVIYIGCAGGSDFLANKKVSYEKCPQDCEPVKLTVGGLLGGHSGGEIHLQRANAISVLARMLFVARDAGYDIRLASFNGGTRRNVIPSSAECLICIPSDHKKEIMSLILDEFDKIKQEYKIQDPGMFETHHCSKCDPNIKRPEKVLTAEDTDVLIGAMFACPHGIYSQSLAVPGVVETSNNLAICKLDDEKFFVEVSTRSLVLSARDALTKRIKLIFDSFGFDTWIGNSYPAWTPNPESSLAKVCADVWKKQTGNDAILTSIHAGLECGVINSKVDGMDSVSIGPDLRDVHSINESLSVSSTERMYEYVKKLLESIK